MTQKFIIKNNFMLEIYLFILENLALYLFN